MKTGSKVTVAISGGIDSIATSVYLKEEGYEVDAVHFLTGYETHSKESIKEKADQIGIDVDFIDIRDAFNEKVVKYFSDSIKSGLTPNPCLFCNPEIKFGLILEEVIKRGSDFFATGHYAKIVRDEKGARLFKGADPVKEQSYFLSFVPKENLVKVLFPLGDRIKTDVKKEMADRGFHSVTGGESQDVCFINEKDYKSFLLKRDLIKESPGDIVNSDGKVIGKHSGAFNFTIGQRKGLNCPAEQPYYVTDIDHCNNTVQVGFKDKAFKTSCIVRDIHWINKPENLENIRTALRYRHKEAKSKLVKSDDNLSEIIFEEPQFAVTPGQGAVFYSEEGEVFGAGWIVK